MSSDTNGIPDDAEAKVREIARDEAEKVHDLEVEDDDGESWSVSTLTERFEVSRRTALKALGLIAVGYAAPRAVLESVSGTAKAASSGNLTVPGELSAGSVSTEALWAEGIDITERHLAADGSTDDGPALQTAIEEEEGNTLIIHEDSAPINIDTQVAPNTSGERTTIVAVGNPTLDVGDAGGDGKLDFFNASNVTLLGPITFTGTNEAGLERALQAGSGFRFREVYIDGGQGGLNIPVSAEDVEGTGLKVTNQHDTENGWAGVLDVKGNEVFISNIYGENCDRGVEVEDGGRNVTLTRGYLIDINNNQATNTKAPFCLDTHRHADAADVRDVTFRDWGIYDSEWGPTASNHATDGVVEAVTFENIRVHGTTGATFEADDVTVRDYHHYRGSRGADEAITVKGGHCIIEDMWVHTTTNNAYVKANEGARIPLEHVEVDGLYGDAVNSGTTTSQAVVVNGDGGNLRSLIIKDYVEREGEAPADDAVEISGGSTFTADPYILLEGGDYGGGTIQPNSGDPLTIRDIDNASLAGSHAFGYPSTIENVELIAPADTPAGVAVNGVGTETANAETPQANWPDGVTVDFTDSGDGSGTGIYQLVAGSWVQVA